MAQHACSEVTLAVDTKKYGIRIHKALFRQLGSPSQIQLLVNPEAKLVAIQPVEKGHPANRGIVLSLPGCSPKDHTSYTADYLYSVFVCLHQSLKTDVLIVCMEVSFPRSASRCFRLKHYSG